MPVGTPDAESPPTVVGGKGVAGKVPGGPEVAGADVEISVAAVLAGGIGASAAEYVYPGFTTVSLATALA